MRINNFTQSKEKNMKFTLLAMLAGLAAGADNPNTKDLHLGGPACNHLNDVVYKATNNSCSIYAEDRIACFEEFKGALTEIPFVYYFAQAQEACKDEIAQERPEPLLKQLKKEQKKEKRKCRRNDLNEDDKYSCKQRPKDIKMLEEVIRNRKKQS